MLIKKIQPYAILVIAICCAVITIDTVMERVSVMSLPEATMTTTSTSADASVSCKVGYSRYSCQPVVIAQPY